jgi:hypothetical protein
MVAAAALPELQETDPVRFWVLPFVYVPVAVNCWLLDGASVRFTGVTANETKAGGVTVRVADPLMEAEVAVMVAVPAATAVASPAELMVATPFAEELQVTVLVRLAVVPLL